MASSDNEQEPVVIEVHDETAHSPANSEVSSSSSNSSSSSSAESDTNEIQCSSAAEKPSSEEVDDVALQDETKQPRADNSPSCGVIPNCTELNGIITLTTPMNHSVEASPPSSDPEDEMNGDIQDSMHMDDYAPEERLHSISDPNSPITATLQSSSANLWRRFDALGTEMIVTRRGRRMFPALKIELFDLDPNTTYTLCMDMVPVDKYRYKYQNSNWVRCFEEECSQTRLYKHPDSPALGSHWMNSVISFHKLKLTNNQLDKQGHIIVNSMHKYQPRLHVVETRTIRDMNQGRTHTFVFPGTQFMTVTAYQNDKITQLKIENNPFAKGFRPPFSRCRGRNQQQRIALHSTGSESSEDSVNYIRSVNHRSLQVVPSPAFDLRRDIIVVNRKREANSDTEAPPTKQICLATTSPKESSPVSLCPPNMFSGRLISSSTHAPQQLVTFASMLTSPRTVGNTVSLVQAGTNPTVIQSPIVSATNGMAPLSILQAPPSRSLQGNGCFVPATANGVQVSNGHHGPINLIQTVNGQPIRVIPQHSLQPTNGATYNSLQVINTAVNLDHSKLPTRTTMSPPSSAKSMSPSPMVQTTISEKGLPIHRSLSSSTSSPPPLVQVKTEADIKHIKCCSPVHVSSPPPPPPSHSLMAAAATLPTQKASYETTATPIPTLQNIYLPASSLPQQKIVLIAADGTGGLDSNGAGTIALPIRLANIEPAQFPQNAFNHSLVPIQLLKLPSNTISTA